jgi:hypothetical protein
MSGILLGESTKGQIVQNSQATKPYQCRVCGEIFSEESNAKRHIESPPDKCLRLARLYPHLTPNFSERVKHKEPA